MKNFFISLGGTKVKTLRQISAATILSLALAISVFAGHIETPGAPAPAPKSGTTTTSPSSETTDATDPTTTTSTSSNDITVILLTILDLIYR